MQLLDDHLWELYDTGRITYEEMLDKSRQPGALQDKLRAKIKGLKGDVAAEKKKEIDDMGQILRT